MDIQKLLRASKSSTSSEEGGGGVRDKGYKRRSVAMESTGKAKALRVIKVSPSAMSPGTTLTWLLIDPFYLAFLTLVPIFLLM